MVFIGFHWLSIVVDGEMNSSPWSISAQLNGLITWLKDRTFGKVWLENSAGNIYGPRCQRGRPFCNCFGQNSQHGQLACFVFPQNIRAGDNLKYRKSWFPHVLWSLSYSNDP